MRVTKQEIRLQDLPLDLDDLTEFAAENLFKVEPLPIRSYEKDYHVQMNINVEMNLNLEVFEREGYTVMDVLSDVGGFQGILVSFFTMIIPIVNYEHFQSHLASRLFRILPPRDVRSKLDREKKKALSQPIVLTRFKNICNCIQDSCPNWLSCVKRKSVKYRAIRRARNHMETEMNIIEIVKSRRYFNMALKLLLSKDTRDSLKKQS